ncbi:MAG: glycosyltransferase family 39 protein [Candidatus Moranbacteria bacterium]|nr:glycosyltransferase family 39 protein [Candidatus Moranbacteria bacterium]
MNSIKQKTTGLIFLLALAVYFSFGLYHLAKFETADEHFWINQDRILQYWNAVEKGDWKATRINNKPGITLAYISGVGLIFDKNHSAEIKERGAVFTSYDPQEFQRINFLYRFPLLIFNGLFSIFFFWVIAKLTENKWIGLWSATLILLSPILLGVSQIVNPDALSWLFCSATIFSYLLFLKTGRKKVVAFTALFLGLALATKYIALILVYYLFFVFIAYLLFYYNKDKEMAEVFPAKILKMALSYLAVVFGGLLIFSLLMPAVFVKSKYLFHDVIDFGHTGPVFWAVILADVAIALDAFFLKSRIALACLKLFSQYKNIIFKGILLIVSGLCFFTLLNWVLKFNFFNLEGVPFDSRQSDFFISLAFWKKLILQARPLVFSLTPLTLGALFLIWIKTIFQKPKYAFLVFVLSAFILIYWLAVTMQGLLVNIRYGIILTPLVLFLAALGIWELSRHKLFQRVNKVIISLLIIVISLVSIWFIKPFYFNYANALLPRESLITGAWGYGGYEAGQFLNSLPRGSGEILVIADYPGVCPFVQAQCVDMNNENQGEINSVLSQNKDNVYLVLTRRGQVRWGYIGQFISVMKKPPLWELKIDDRPGNFIRVYKQ